MKDTINITSKFENKERDIYPEIKISVIYRYSFKYAGNYP